MTDHAGARRWAGRIGIMAAMVVGLALNGAPARAASDDLYVSTNGSDSAAGTQSSPWRTLRFALSQVGRGQTLYIRGGTYVENVKLTNPRRGTPSERVTAAWLRTSSLYVKASCPPARCVSMSALTGPTSRRVLVSYVGGVEADTT